MISSAGNHFSCAATEIAVQEIILLCSIGSSCSGNPYAAQQGDLPDYKPSCSIALQAC
jgi:hypothetical protein